MCFESSKGEKNAKKGFTLVELIVVVAILGILAAIVIPRFSQYVAQARWEKTNANALTVYRAMTVVEADLIEEGIIQYPAPGGMYYPTVNEEFKKRVQAIVPSNITINTAYNNGSVKPTDNENIYYINYTPPGSSSPYGVLYVDMRLPSYTNPSGFTGPTMFFWRDGVYGLDYKPF